jgi:prepilin-type N-terminal cleavage/methylation domain-containing protein
MELKPNQRGRERGYTLIELMIVALIVGILFSLGSQILVPMSRLIRINFARGEVQREMRTSLQLMEPLLRQARRETILFPPVTPKFGHIKFQTMDGRDFYFYQNGRNLIMQEGTKPQVIVSRLLNKMIIIPADISTQNYFLSLCMSKSPGGMDNPISKIQKVRISLRDR